MIAAPEISPDQTEGSGDFSMPSGSKPSDEVVRLTPDQEAEQEFAVLERIVQEQIAAEAKTREHAERADEQIFKEEWRKSAPDRYFTDKVYEQLDERFHPIHKKF